MNKILIYALIDPTTNRIKYVGGTRQLPEIRLKQHIARAMNLPVSSTKVSCWIRSLAINNILPLIKTLHICEGDSFFKEEIEWIAFCKWAGCDLTNSTGGGEHNPPYTLSEQTRANMSKAKLGTKHSDATKKKFSLAKKGIPKTDKHKEAISKANTGHKVTQDTKDNIHYTKMMTKRRKTQSFSDYPYSIKNIFVDDEWFTLC